MVPSVEYSIVGLVSVASRSAVDAVLPSASVSASPAEPVTVNIAYVDASFTGPKAVTFTLRSLSRPVVLLFGVPLVMVPGYLLPVPSSMMVVASVSVMDAFAADVAVSVNV